MNHAIYSVTRAEVVGPWTLRVEFNDGRAQVINFWPILAGELYGPLRDVAVFNQVRVDPEAHTIVWPNGADFDPATLHDWPEYEKEWIAQAKKWAKMEDERTSAPGGNAEASLRVAESTPPYATGSTQELANRLRLDKPLIQLWGGPRLGLIILRPSGVYYSNQTGGYACLHPTVEGVFVPIRVDELDLERELSEYFTGAKWQGWCCRGIDEETAIVIDGLLAQCDFTRGIRVDRNRLRDSHEAWVYVDYANLPETEWRTEISGFGACKAVLTWENSD
jgi:hypothetical protein